MTCTAPLCASQASTSPCCPSSRTPQTYSCSQCHSDGLHQDIWWAWPIVPWCRRHRGQEMAKERSPQCSCFPCRWRASELLAFVQEQHGRQRLQRAFGRAMWQSTHLPSCTAEGMAETGVTGTCGGQAEPIITCDTWNSWRLTLENVEKKEHQQWRLDQINSAKKFSNVTRFAGRRQDSNRVHPEYYQN